MTEKTKHTPAAALTGVQIAAPLNPHGQCFGLIPQGGDWLDDLIDWSRRQFKRPEDAQRVAASWNLLVDTPLEVLLQPTQRHPEAVKLRAALDACKAQAASFVSEPSGFNAAVACLDNALRALAAFGNSDLTEVTTLIEFAGGQIASAVELLYTGAGNCAAPLDDKTGGGE